MDKAVSAGCRVCTWASDPFVVGAIFLLFVIPGLALGQATASPNCKLIASPPPLATFGGPATATRGYTELALAVGGYAELPPSPCDHGGGTDWFARWRRGLSNRIDLGFDVVGDQQSDGSFGATAKVAVRYQVNPGFRLEGGLGAADEGDGRSGHGSSIVAFAPRLVFPDCSARWAQSVISAAGLRPSVQARLPEENSALRRSSPCQARGRRTRSYRRAATPKSPPAGPGRRSDRPASAPAR